MKAKLLSAFTLNILLIFITPLGFVSAYAQQDDADVSTSRATDPGSNSQVPDVDPVGVNANGQYPITAESIDTSSVTSLDSAANAASTAEASTAETGNQYGLEALWEQGDVIARGTLFILVAMSAATWYVLVTKLIQQQGLLSQAKKTHRFWETKNVTDGVKVYQDDSAYRAVAEDGILAAKQHAERRGERIELSDWLVLQLQRSVERITSQLQSGLSLLATVGSCSPFVGLFGTVWGIYHALIAIGLAGQASIDKVAGPVGEALIMTAIGLAVAVPAVLGYNWLVRRNKIIVESLRNFAADIHANLAMGVPGGKSE